MPSSIKYIATMYKNIVIMCQYSKVNPGYKITFPFGVHNHRGPLPEDKDFYNRRHN
ncbi:UNVERIFIED_CONTAM: hypothetical protein FKN15_041650 [Acipenser sinensis]